ncbi:MAG: hypothetical protein N2485_08335, partial [bacterium]|nr:hypothetical protein [bacterium]
IKDSGSNFFFAITDEKEIKKILKDEKNTLISSVNYNDIKDICFDGMYIWILEKENLTKALNNDTMSIIEKFSLTEELKEIEKKAKEAYQNLAKVARAIFINDKARLSQLGIEGKMPTRTADFILKGYTIFNNAMSIDEIRTALAHFGYDDKKLKEEKQKIVEFEKANNKQEAAKGEAQQATKDQEAALKNLSSWLSQYIKIARVALKDQKQLLEKIGVGVYSSKTAAQRQGQKKASLTKKTKKEQ